MPESQFSIFLFSLLSTFDNMHGDMQSLSLDGRQFLASTGWRKSGKLDFMCQQNWLLLEALEEPARVGWGWFRQMGPDTWIPKQGVRIVPHSHETKCVFTANNTWRGGGARTRFVKLKCGKHCNWRPTWCAQSR